MLSIAIIEDTLRHREIIANHITNNTPYQLVTTASNGFDFVSYCMQAKTLPDIALIDIQMNIMDGIALTDFLQQFFPTIKCIGVTNYMNDETVLDMVTCGALGMVFKIFVVDDYLLTNEQRINKFTELNNCIAYVAKGDFYMGEHIKVLANTILPQLDRNALIGKRQQQIQANAMLNLTDKERIITTLCAGSSIKLDVIADVLCMNIKTLESSLTQIYKKLDIAGRLDLTHYCISKAIIFNSRNTVSVKYA